MFKVTNVFFLSVLLAGCEPSNVTRLCRDHLSQDQYCVTAFFVERDTLVTVHHVMDDDDDSRYRLATKGSWDTVVPVDTAQERDLAWFAADDNLVLGRDVVPVCSHEPLVGDEVAILGVRTRSGEIEKMAGEVVEVGERWVQIDVLAPLGFSGAPVVDVDRGCAIGAVCGQKNGGTQAGRLRAGGGAVGRFVR